MSDIKVMREKDKARVAPPGNIVTSAVPGLRSALRALIQDGAREIVFDLGDVEMVDSSGIGLLIATHNSLLKTGGVIEVVRASEDLLNLFRAMRLHQHFSISGK